MADPYNINDYSAANRAGLRPDERRAMRRAAEPGPAVGRTAAEGGIAPTLPNWMTGQPENTTTIPMRAGLAAPEQRGWRAAPEAQLAEAAPAAAMPVARRAEANINFRPANQLGGPVGASIAAMDDDTKASMRYDQFMRDMGRQRFGSARRAVTEAYTGNERNRAELAGVERRSRAEEATAMTRANADIATSNARGALDAQVANTEAGLKRRGQNLDYAVATAKGGLSPKDLLEMDKTRLEMAKLSADQARTADQYEQSRPGILEKVVSPRIEAMRKAGMSEDRIAIESAKDAMRLGLDPNSAPTAAAGRDALLQSVESLYNQNDFTPINVWGIGDEGAPGSSLTARGLTPGDLQDPTAVRASETGLARRLLLGAPRYRYEVTDKNSGKPNVRYSDDETLYNDLGAMRRLSRRSE